MRRLAALVTAALLAIGLLAGSPTLAQAKKPSPITVAPSPPQRGIAFTLSGKLPTKVIRPVQAQYKSGSKWKQLASGKTTKSGSYKFTVTTIAAKLSVRVVAAGVKIKHHKYPKLTTKTKTFTTAMPPTPVITTDRLPLTTVTLHYSAALAVLGGAAPYVWSATGLPNGLAISPTTGQITGTTTDPGTYPVAISATDNLGQNTTKAFNIQVGTADRLISAGWMHTCAINASGALKCWGNNGSGRLGDNTTTNRNTGVQVFGLTRAVVAVAAGSAHTCALLDSGFVYCWGENSQGQLGDGTTTDRVRPTLVKGLNAVTAIDAGAANTCALSTLGAPFCWGDNAKGQIGDNTTTNRTTITWVHYLLNIKAISVGGTHVCVVTEANAAKCWGDNSQGELGDGGTTNQKVPEQVSGLIAGASAISAGAYHSCAVTNTSAVKCWGDNAKGELGDGTLIDRLTPTPASGLSSGSFAFLGGGTHFCVLTFAFAAKCWGNNGYGQLGNGTTANQSVQVQVSGLASNITAITAGGYHTCALTASGVAKCWGLNDSGQLGNGTNLTSPTAVEVNSLG